MKRKKRNKPNRRPPGTPPTSRSPGIKGRDAMEGAGKPALYQKEFAEQARKLCLLGATDMELADFFGVTWRTIYRWKNEHEEFAAAVVIGKDKADERVERSLYTRAVGYEHDAHKIFMPAGAVRPVYAPYTEHVPPDVGAMKLWLISRRPDVWREKQTLAVGGDPDGVPIGVSGLDEFFGAISRLAVKQRAGSTDAKSERRAGKKPSD